MVACDNPQCQREWFHAKCVGIRELPAEDEPWYCSATCRKVHRGKPKKRGNNSQEQLDNKYEHTKTLVWRGLSDVTKREAVRENDGPAMIMFWKLDMAEFANHNHYKYFILGHRLLTSINGWKPKRVVEDLTWNRTVNMKGGAGNNLEMDLVNEFLNREFKESIDSVGSRLTQDTLDRPGKLAGGVGKYLDTLYATVTDTSTIYSTTRKDDDRRDDMNLFISLLKPEKLVQNVPGRSHKAFKNFKVSTAIKNVQSFNDRIAKLSKKLDTRKREVAN